MIVNVKNFKSIASVSIRLDTFNLIIGANASGKTNFIEALRLMKWLGEGNHLYDLVHDLSPHRSTSGQGLEIRGTINDLTRRGSSTLNLGISGVQFEKPDHPGLKWSAELGFDTRPRLRYECLGPTPSESKIPYLKTDSQSGELNTIYARYNNFTNGGKKPTIPCRDSQLVISQLQTPAPFTHKQSQKLIPVACQAILNSLTSLRFLDPAPRQMRSYSHKQDMELAESASNISSVLFQLCQDADQKQALLDFVSKLPEQNFTGIDFIVTERDDVMVKLEEQFGTKKEFYDAAVLSDGTLRVLAIAAAVLSAPEHSIIVIEEIDNGIHPSRIENLLEQLTQVAETRRLKIVAISHNPVLANSIPQDALRDVIYCYRDNETGNTRLSKLRDIERSPKLLVQGSLGELMTKRTIENYVKNPPSDAVDKQQIDDWLASLEAN